MAWLVGLGLSLAGGQAIAAASLPNVAAGVWSAAGSWTACGGGAPGAADTATIQNGHVISLDAAAGTFTMSGGTITLMTVGAGAVLCLPAGKRCVERGGRDLIDQSS